MKKSLRLGISKMHCSNCSNTIEKYFNSKEGISVSVLLSDNEGLFQFDDSLWNEAKIKKELKKNGYPASKNTEKIFDLVKLIICILATLPFVVAMFFMHQDHDFLPGVVQLILASIVEVVAGYPFFIGMIKNIKNKSLGMDVLITLGTLTAYIYSLVLFILSNYEMLYFETSAMVLTIVTLGKTIEKEAKRKTSSSLKGLMSLQEKSAYVFKDDAIIETNINDIEVDDIVVVSTGKNIPLDGYIVSGTGEINESMITGESLPVIKNENDLVLAGTILVSGNIRIKVSKNSKETYLSNMINKVEQIQSEKPRMQKIADKIANFFVPTVIAIAILCLFITFLIKSDWEISIKRSIAVLMVSCPCSLGLATPLSILVGSSRAIKLSIIYNNTEIFEKAIKIDAICFDKTGTLSEGVFEVVKYESSDENAINIIYSMESISSHPIAKALIDYAISQNAKIIELEATEIPGQGIKAKDYFIYKKDSFVYLEKNNKIIASVEIVDKIKDDAKDTIQSLKDKNIKIYLLTGDNQKIAYDVASKLSIDLDKVLYEIKPDEKLQAIEKLQEDNYVAFVGDGINDSLALNKANLSIAMGNGADIAIDSSDIVLANGNLANIESAINLSKAIYHNIIGNFVWAFSYNAVTIPLAFFGILNPMVAGICMAFSSIMVVLNALRLFKKKI